MKRNKIMALTALLTLLGAPSSKAQEVKGDSKQPTSAQSANKDSEAVDKTKEQNKNLDKTKDSKAPQQAKDSKTPQQKKEQTKDSNPSGAKSFVNRMMSLGYSMEWIRKNWPWLAAMGGTGVVSAVAGNKMGKKANVGAKVQDIVATGYKKNDEVAANYVLKTDEEGIKAEAEKLGIRYTDGDLEAKAQQKAQQLANGKKYTDEELNNKVNEVINQRITDKELVEANNEDAVKTAAKEFGIKYTDNELEQRIDAAVSVAKGTGLLTRIVDENKKEPFDNYVEEMDEQLQCSLRNIQKALGGSFQSIFAITTYSDEDEIPNDKVVNALNMLADIKNALVDKQALDFEASFANTKGTEDGAWSDFGFKLGSKEYEVYVKHTENEEICIKVDEDEYSISLKNVEIEKVDGGEEEGEEGGEE